MNWLNLGPIKWAITKALEFVASKFPSKSTTDDKEWEDQKEDFLQPGTRMPDWQKKLYEREEARRLKDDK